MDYCDSLLYNIVSSDNNIESLQKLLARKKDPNLADSSGDTILHIAAKSSNDNPGIVQELINAGADVSRLDGTSSTALHFAVKRGKRKVFDVLLQTEIPINQKNQLGITALHYAINRNISPIFNTCEPGTDTYIVRKLLDHRLINVNETDSYKQTPLVWAININNLEIVKLLLNKNARVDISDTFRRTPLHHALFNRNCNIAIALLLKQASLYKTDGDGQTPLNNIINSQTVEFSCQCLKVIAFNYGPELSLTNKITPKPELWEFLKKCWKEIDYMKKDIIVSDLTVFDFFSKCAAKPIFDNPILQIYKPVVETLFTGKYPVYIDYILNRTSKSTLHAVLEFYINDKFENKSCPMEYFTDFSKITKNRLLREYLSNEEIFCLIAAFTGKTVTRCLLDFHEPVWCLNDLWEVYSDEHFLKVEI